MFRWALFARYHRPVWVELGLAVALFPLAASTGQAQTPNSAPLPNLQVPLPPIQNIQPPTEPPRTLPEPPQTLPAPGDLFKPTPNPVIPEIEPGQGPETITVERFEILGSTVFSAEELAQVTAPFTNRPISLETLFQVRTAITQYYLDRGYITSGALIPPQKIQEGVVKIQVIEGGLEDIKVGGTTKLDPGYIRSRLEIATGAPLNRDRLLEALQLLKLNPLIQSVSAELASGTQPGKSILEVTVVEAKTFSAQLKFDNGRSPSVGTDRRQIQLNEANLLGLGDSLTLTGTNTDGSNEFDASYTLPINPYNGSISLSYSTSSSNVIEKPFNILDITARSSSVDLTLRQPLIQTPTQEFALGLTASRRESGANLLGGQIPFPALGADSQGNTVVSALRFFQEFTQRNSQEVLALRSQVSLGLAVLGATQNSAPPDGQFLAWRGQAQYVRLLAPDTLFLLRGDMQLADRALVGLEQFGVGGMESLRGYRQDTLLTDNGFFASVELRLPILRIPEAEALLQVTPFVDFATAWNQTGRPNPDPSTLAAAGLGLRLQMSNSVTAKFEWGIPLVSVNQNARTWQENGLYFSVVYTSFF